MEVTKQQVDEATQTALREANEIFIDFDIQYPHYRKAVGLRTADILAGDNSELYIDDEVYFPNEGE